MVRSLREIAASTGDEYLTIDGELTKLTTEHRRDLLRLADQIERRLIDYRIVPRIRVADAGYNAHTRTTRMIQDLVKRKGLELGVADSQRLRQGGILSDMPLAAREVFLGLLAILTDEELLPDYGDGRPPDSLEPVLVPIRGGLAQLADVCGYRRIEGKGEYGPTHSRSAIRRVREGLELLVSEPHDLVHIWREFDKSEGETVTRYVWARSTIAQSVSEGTVQKRLGEQADFFLTVHGRYVGLHPYALLGAQTNYHELPGDFLVRYQQALDSAKLAATSDSEMRRIVGRSPRRIASDVEFGLWCVMHTRSDRQKSVAISDEKLMDRVGLGGYLEQRKFSTASKRLQRAVIIARQMGVLDSVEQTTNGIPIYVLPGPQFEEPPKMVNGTLDIEEMSETGGSICADGGP